MDEQNNYSVYIHINKINNMKYIGCTGINPIKRWGYGSGYSNGQEKFYNAIKEFGWNNFEHIVIKDGLSKKEAWDLEEHLILELDTINNGYNAAYGGEKNRLSEASKQKLRKQRMGEKNPNYNPNKNHTYTKSGNMRIKQKRKKKHYTFPDGETSTAGRKSIEFRNHSREMHLGDKNPNYGKHTWCFGIKMTEQQKQKMYEAWTEERRKLISEQKKGNKNPQAKKVLCVDTGITYDTIVDAAKANNLSERTVSDCCNGRTKYPKIKFKFEEEGDK